MLSTREHRKLETILNSSSIQSLKEMSKDKIKNNKNRLTLSEVF
jgi:hypothetical protein